MDEFEMLPNMPLNRYAKKKRHKWEMKKRHTKGLYNRITTPQFDEMKMRERYEEFLGTRWNDERNGGYTYWQTYYLSGPRTFAKKATNRKIRTKYREMISNADYQNVCALSGSDYEKEFDYWWTVF